jgi:putative DNA primase/helicase
MKSNFYSTDKPNQGKRTFWHEFADPTRKPSMQAFQIIEAAHDAFVAGGVHINEPLIADGALHRAHIDGDKLGTKNGAYFVHADSRPNAWAMSFKTGVVVRWTASGKHQPMTFAQRSMIVAERQRRQADHKRMQDNAADAAMAIWNQGIPIVTQDQHTYLIAKQVHPHDLRLSSSGDGALLIPIWSSNRELVNVQRIFPNGDKRFLSGGRKKGCFAVIGRPNDMHLLVCEGFATGASLFEVTGIPVLVALDAGNLESVAMAARSLWPDATIVIAGDNDESGTGQKAAKSAALACGGKCIIPSTRNADWNDFINDRDINALKVANTLIDAFSKEDA